MPSLRSSKRNRKPSGNSPENVAPARKRVKRELLPELNESKSSSKKRLNKRQSERKSKKIRSSNVSVDGLNRKDKVDLKLEIKEEMKIESLTETESESAGVHNTNSVSSDSGTDMTQAEPEDSLSEYEKLRIQNLKDNAAFLAKLGIMQAKENLAIAASTKKPKPAKRGLKEKTPKVKEPIMKRVSLRLMNKDPDGTDLPERPVVQMYQEDEHPRKPAEAINMKEDVKNVSEDQTEVHEKFLTCLCRIGKEKKQTLKVNIELQSYVKELRKMRMTEHCVAKVVPNRTFSVVIHPTVDKILVATGDKWGRLGIWDVESNEGQDGVFSYEPHSRPINCLNFNPYNHNQLLSCGYDGTLRSCDLSKAVFDLIYSTPEDDDVRTNAFDFLDAHTVLMALSDGKTATIDLRMHNSEKAEGIYNTHVKSNRCVSIHPVQKQYFITSCYDGKAELWDLRKMSKSKPHGLDVLLHSKTLSSAYFSPVTGSHIVSTSMDDRIRIWDSSDVGSSINLKYSMKHNNHTGRWLTKFRAVWHPTRDDLFIVGSMARPRRIELFSNDASLVHEFLDEDYLNSVCSLNAFHPTRNIVVGANSSGRLHVFK